MHYLNDVDSADENENDSKSIGSLSSKRDILSKLDLFKAEVEILKL